MEYNKWRSRAGPQAFLQHFEGALQSDGYTVYEMFEKYPSITLYACMAHARRKFHECLTSDPDEAAYALSQFNRLYGIERELRQEDASADRRREVRQKSAKPILDGLEAWMRGHKACPPAGWARRSVIASGVGIS